MKTKYLRFDKKAIGLTFLWGFLLAIIILPIAFGYFGGTITLWIGMPPFAIYSLIVKGLESLIDMSSMAREIVRTIFFLMAIVVEFLYVNFFVTLYLNRKEKNQPIPITPTGTNTDSSQLNPTPVQKISFAKNLGWLLLLQYSVLIVYLLAFVASGFKVDGEGFGMLIWIFGMTLFLPISIASLILFFKYIGNTVKNWKQLEKIQKSNFALYFVQLIIYFYVLTLLP